jgi:hypothetical protein
MIDLKFIDAQNFKSVHGNGGVCFYNPKFYLLSQKTHTFAQCSSVKNISGEKCVLPGAALIGGKQNEKSRETACALLSLMGG